MCLVSAIFIPDGHDVPFGAMPLAEKNRISHRAQALQQFIEHCRSAGDALLDGCEPTREEQ